MYLSRTPHAVGFASAKIIRGRVAVRATVQVRTAPGGDGSRSTWQGRALFYSLQQYFFQSS